MSDRRQVEYLSAAAVSRLSHTERQAFFRNVVNDDSGSDDTVLCDEDDQDNNDDSHSPNNAYVDSDAETEQMEVEINEESDSNEEYDSADDDTSDASADGDFYETKDGVKWFKNPPRMNRHSAHNIIRENRFMGPNPITKNLSKVDIFNCIFSSTVREMILQYSNEKAETVYADWNTQNPAEQPRTWKSITDVELSAFFGILLVMGCHQSNQESIKVLWKKHAYPIYRATMARNRFEDILRFLRFDSASTRAVRRETDKAAPIRDVFEKIVSNLETHYRPHESITVDEQLYGFRGRTPFTQYMPSKPAKYGMKIWWACDSMTFYPLRGQLYVGKVNNVRDVNQGERVVKDLVGIYKGSGRNITTDNFFTTLQLAKDLMTWSMSIVGTLKKNKRYLPQEFKPSSTRYLKSSLFGFSEKVTLCSYVPSKKKSVVLLSTLHQDNATSGPDKKPEIILYYNTTKGGVDTMDKMLSQYSTKRSTLRWPMSMFYNLLDLAALAAFIIFKENNSLTSVKNSQRRNFIENLGEDLCRPMILERSKNPHVMSRLQVKTAIECLLGEPVARTFQESETDEIEGRDASGRVTYKGKCYVCYSHNQQRRSTRNICIKCKKPICSVHSIKLCQTKCKNC